MTRGKISRRAFVGSLAAAAARGAKDAKWSVEIEQLTFGPKHHYFGYIGHVGNTPWNGNNRYLSLLRTTFQDRMPGPSDVADVVLVDTKDENKTVAIDQCRAWNPQQGTMFYWNPKARDTQLFFNDRDPKTGRVFAVLYDVAKHKRTREYKFDDTPFGNSGVAQKGGFFLGLNYGRMAKLRQVTGYVGSYNWTDGIAAPENDGIFLTEIESGKKRILVSFKQLADLLAPSRPDVREKHLFINHTLWNRDDNRIYFYVRGDFDAKVGKIDIPCTIRPDGSGLRMHKYIGGHPEWEFGPHVIGLEDRRQVLYDVDRGEITGLIGNPEILPQPDGDSALSFDGKWFVNGYRVGHEDFYTVLNRADGTFVKTKSLPVDNWLGGDLRLDPAPCWNRTNNTIAAPAIADDAGRTRQTFLLRINAAGK
jgi:hypothetical protein